MNERQAADKHYNRMNSSRSDLEPITDLSCGRNERQAADKHYNRMNSSLLPISSCLQNSRMNQSSFSSFCHSSYLHSVKTRRKMGLGCSCFHYHMVFRINFIRGLLDILQYGERSMKGRTYGAQDPRAKQATR